MAPLSKRPRGIKQPTAFNPDDSSSAAAVDEAYQAKKSKTSTTEGGEEEEEADSPEEVWEDAKDLWERAMEAAGESDPSSAIPLLRGIIHEFDRILRNSASEQPLDVQPSSTSLTGEPYSKHAFYYIYATSLSTLGLLLSQLPQLAHPSEPSPLDFQIAASGFFTQHQPPSSSSSWSSWKFPLAHARTLVLSASEKLDEDPTDEGAEEHTTTPEGYIKEGIKNFEVAIANLPPSTPTTGTSEAASNRDPITTFLHSTVPLQLRLRTLLSVATSIGVLVERIDNPSDRISFATWADDLLARVGTESTPAAGTKAVDGSEWEYEVAVGRGAVWLGVAGREAELVESEEDASKDNLSVYLEKSLAFLSKARELKPLAKKIGEGEEVEDELSPMLVEVALTFGLVLDGEGEEEVARREELEELARREGWNGEDEEDEEEDGEDEEDEE